MDILLVDDNLSLIKTLKLFLKGEGHEVYATPCPLEAFKLATERQFDLIIADLVMPEMDGIELIEKCTTIHSSLKAILITGHWDRLEAQQVTQCPACLTVLPKPLDIDRLMEEIKNMHVVG